MANPGSSTVGVFLRSSNGTYADLPLPPGLPSNAGPPANAISNNGAVVLSEYTNLYFFNGSTYTTVAVAGAGGALNAVTVGGIDDAGDVAGFYYALDGSTNSFIRYANGTFQPIYVPGSTYTEVLGMNDLGQVVGFYAEGNEQYGFIWTSSGITTLNVPGAVDTDPSGINDAGIIVGSYTDSTGGIHGFIADPTPEPASLAMMIACVVALLVTRGLHRRCARNRQV
jgi:uncharacterized membrane protein